MDMDKKSDKKTEDASDEQLEGVAGGHDRFRDGGGAWREGEWEGHHYHNGYRGRWQGGVWINL